MGVPPEGRPEEDSIDDFIVILDDGYLTAEPEPSERARPAARQAPKPPVGSRRAARAPAGGVPGSRPGPRTHGARVERPAATRRRVRAAGASGTRARGPSPRRPGSPARGGRRRATPEALKEKSAGEGPPRVSRAPRIYLIAGVVTTALLVLLFVAGSNYYTLPFSMRPFHAQHGVLRPSGRFGLVLGIAGTALMVLNLTYLARRQLISLEWLGSLRSWMAFHVLTGLVGPALIVFHTAFAPTSYLGVLALSAMLVVVFAGIFGRYIYAFVPRSLAGHELELEEVRKRLAGYHAQLSRLGVDSRLLQQDSQGETIAPGGVFGTLLGIVFGDPESRREYRNLRAAVRSREQLRARSRRILPLARRLCRERQWLARYQELRSLMGVWRFLHRWLAIVMLLVVLLHIALAVRFGDLWIFQAKD